jgi:hypothetical protein
MLAPTSQGMLAGSSVPLNMMVAGKRMFLKGEVLCLGVAEAPSPMRMTPTDEPYAPA